MKEEIIETNALVKIIETSGLEQTKANFILEKFSGYFKVASEWEMKAKMLIVTDVSQVTEMKMAREGRLYLKGKRVDLEKARKDLKEQSLREGRTIDNIAAILKNLIEPIENYLEKQEKFAEIKEAEFKEFRKDERIKKLLPFNVNFTLYDLYNMTDTDFDQLFKGIELEYNQRIEAEKKAEADRIAKSKAEVEERERIIKENEQLRKEAEERENEIAKQKAELKAKEEAEYFAKCKAEELAENERKAKLAAEKKERTAPDRTKILALIGVMEKIVLPEMKSDEGKKLMETVSISLTKFINYLKAEAEKFNN